MRYTDIYKYLSAEDYPSHSVDNYGAVGDGVTDDTTALQNCLNDALGTSGVAYIPFGRYKITSPLIVRGSVDCNPNAIIMVDPTVCPTGIYVGGEDDVANDEVTNQIINLPYIYCTNKQWSNGNIGNDVGVRVAGAKQNEFHISKIHNFSIGLQLTGESNSGINCNDGTVDNIFFVKDFRYNGINLQLKPVTGGWVNNNTFFGGLLKHLNLDRAGTRHIEIDTVNNASSAGPNCNRFIGMNFEGNGVDYAVLCNSQENYWLWCYWEGNHTVYFSGKPGGGTPFARGNEIYGGYDENTITLRTNNSANNNNHITMIGNTRRTHSVQRFSNSLSLTNEDEGHTGQITSTIGREIVGLTGASVDTSINVPSGSLLKGAQFNVESGISYFWDADFIGGSTTNLVSSGSTSVDTKKNVLIVPEVASAQTNVRFSPNGGGTFASGAVEVLVYYDYLTDMGDH